MYERVNSEGTREDAVHGVDVGCLEFDCVPVLVSCGTSLLHTARQVFEPRYRLMVRRCMEGNRRFGMAVRMHDREDVEALATEAEITECSLMPDGCGGCHWAVKTHGWLMH